MIRAGTRLIPAALLAQVNTSPSQFGNMPVRYYSANSAARFATQPAADTFVRTAANQVAAVLPENGVQRFVKFMTSKETFYRFWGEMIGAVVSGSFLLAATAWRKSI